MERVESPEHRSPQECQEHAACNKRCIFLYMVDIFLAFQVSSVYEGYSDTEERPK